MKLNRMQERLILLMPLLLVSPSMSVAGIEPSCSDLRSWEELTTVFSPIYVFTSVSFSPDSTRLAAADGDVRIFDSRTLELTRVIADSTVYRFAWSPDSTRIAGIVAYGPMARLWDVETGTPLRLFQLPSIEGFFALAWSPDGSQLALGDEQCSVVFGCDVTTGSVAIFDPDSGELVRRFTAHDGRISGIAWSSDGSRIGTISYDGTLKVWDALSFDLWRTFRFQDVGASLAWSPDGTRIVGSNLRYLLVWQVDDATVQLTVPHDRIQTLAWTPYGSFVVGAGGFFPSGPDYDIHFWNADSGEAVRMLTGHTANVLSIALSPDGCRLASGSADQTLRVWGIRD